MRRIALGFWIVLVGLLFAGQALAQTPRRVALVIGNDKYQFVPELKKAVNDANAMERELKAAGFEVSKYVNLTDRAQEQALARFTKSVRGGDEVVLYFAGHGVQIRSGSYLLPVDIQVASEREIEKFALGLQDLMDVIAAARPAFTLIVVDACRDNPLAKIASRSVGIERGLIPAEPAKGQMVIYSAGKGQTALDRLTDNDADPNGVFTREFIKRMRQPGVAVRDLVEEVQDAVEKLARSIGHEQRPAVYSETRGNFYFRAPVTVQVQPAAPAPVPVVAVPPAQLAMQEESKFWDEAKAVGSADGFQAYLDQYPNGRFVGLARAYIKRLATEAAAAKPAAEARPAPAIAADSAAPKRNAGEPAAATVPPPARTGPAQGPSAPVATTAPATAPAAAVAAATPPATSPGTSPGTSPATAGGTAPATAAATAPARIRPASPPPASVSAPAPAVNTGTAASDPALRGVLNVVNEQTRAIGGIVPDKTSAGLPYFPWLIVGAVKDKAQAGDLQALLAAYRREADAGNSVAQASLAIMLEFGVGAAARPGEAVRWHRQAAEQGYAPAQVALGHAILRGRGVNRDEAEAARWYAKSAAQGFALGQVALGEAYLNGTGVTKDDKEAVEWYRKAAEQGDPYGEVALGSMYASGRGVAREDGAAVRWYRKSAVQGNSRGQNALGFMYQDGRGIAQSFIEAAAWYRKSAEQGYAPAQSNLGWLYANGRGVFRDNAEALNWYRKAAEQGFAAAQIRLGAMYEDGRAGTRDLSEAVKWYRKAAEQGSEEAKSILARLDAR